MRTSNQRNAWGVSIARNPDSAIEWELGSRVMNDLEAENRRGVGPGAIMVRLERANRVLSGVDMPEDGYIDCLVQVKGRKELYFVYDEAEDGRLMATQVEPRLKSNEGDFTLIPPEMVEDWTPWDKAVEGCT